MAKVTKFEDLICWQKARTLVRNVYSISKSGELSKDFGLKDQLQRAAVSSMTNIAEGFARYHRKEFIRFLDISQSSTTEVKSLLYVVLDQQYLDSESVKSLQDDSDEVHALTMGLLKYLDSSISTNKVSEHLPEYGNTIHSWDIPNEFINRDTQTHRHTNT